MHTHTLIKLIVYPLKFENDHLSMPKMCLRTCFKKERGDCRVCSLWDDVQSLSLLTDTLSKTDFHVLLSKNITAYLFLDSDLFKAGETIYIIIL